MHLNSVNYLMLLLKKNGINSLKQYTLITKFQMTEFKGSKSFIFSFIGCKGFNVFIDEEGALEIGDFCSDNRLIKTNILVPLNDKCILYLNFENNKLQIQFTITGEPSIEKVFDLNYSIENVGPIAIGKSAGDSGDYFNGNIDAVLLYDSKINRDMVNPILDSLKVSGSKGSAKKEKTLDGRDCVRSCSDNPIPGSKGAEDPPSESKLDPGPVQVPRITGKEGKGGKGGKGQKEKDVSGKGKEGKSKGKK